MMSADVFSEELTADLMTKYGNLERVDRPDIYFLAIDEYYHNHRIEINEWLPTFSSSSQSRILKNLLGTGQAMNTYHELVVASLLLQRFYGTLEYEYAHTDRLGNICTPDWTLFHDGKTVLAVEVFTDRMSDDSAIVEREWSYLANKLKSRVSGNYVICVDRNHAKIERLDRETVDLIVNELNRWLLARPTIGDRRIVYGLPIEIVAENYPTGFAFIVSGPFFYLGTRSLRNKSLAKLTRYRNLETPLAIAVIPAFLPGHDLEDFRDVLLGTTATRLYLDANDQLVGSEQVREMDGLATREVNAKLSAGFWISGEPNNWSMDIVENPNAIVALPPIKTR